MSDESYYPNTNAGRDEWWQNIDAKAADILPQVDFTPAEVTSVVNDAKWGQYCYDKLRTTFEHFFQEVTAYANTVSDGIGGMSGEDLPDLPVVPAWPTIPVGVIKCDFESRRADWVQRVKSSPKYNTSIGEALRIIRTVAPFDPAAYTPELKRVSSPEPKTFSAKFRRANGNVDGVIVYGRKNGTSTWAELGRFNSTPFSCAVPTTVMGPEEWEFQVRAFKKDVPFGNMSPVYPVIVRG